MSNNWDGLRATVDGIVDNIFGEPVEFHPTLNSTNDYEDMTGPDPSRPVIKTTGILVNKGAATTGEGGTEGGGMSARVAVEDVWLSITDDKFDYRLNKDDRIYFPDRDEWYEFGTLPIPVALHRPNIPLIRVTGSDTTRNG